MKKIKKYTIEKITGDNRRPGMPEQGYLVRFRPHPTFGWLCCETFRFKTKAKAFAMSLTPEGDRPKEA